MKKNLTTKLLSLTLVTAMTLSLTACGKTADQPAGSSTTPAFQEAVKASAGALLLSVNPEIELYYDESGNVVALTGINDDGQSVLAAYTGYEGRPCKTVVGELVNQINAAGYFDTTIDGQERNIVLKLARGSQYPSDDFLNELTQEVQTVVEADRIGSQTVALDDDDYDDVHGDKGYINAAAAQSILATQLGRADIQFVEKEYDLDDGEYEVEFILDGVKYEYEVNALTGKVIEVDMDSITDDNDDDDDNNDDGISDDDNDDGISADYDDDDDDSDDGISVDNDDDDDDSDDGISVDNDDDDDDSDDGISADYDDDNDDDNNDDNDDDDDDDNDDDNNDDNNDDDDDQDD